MRSRQEPASGLILCICPSVQPLPHLFHPQTQAMSLLLLTFAGNAILCLEAPLPTCTPVVSIPAGWSSSNLLYGVCGHPSPLSGARQQAGTRLPPPARLAAFRHAWPGRCGPCVRFISGPFLQAPAPKEEKKPAAESSHGVSSSLQPPPKLWLNSIHWGKTQFRGGLVF